MTFHLSEKSLRRLDGVDPKLVAVVKRAIEITPIDFVVIEGLRTKARQAYLLSAGKSKTMNSYHLTGHAVDIAPIVDGKVSWDWKYFHPLADAMKQAAEEFNVQITWGGSWKSFPDGPHFQIARDTKG
jgi:peptidoglycan L-alanyl-D-glutamate endopeptidase CwlK